MGPGPNQKGLSRKAIFDAIDASLKRLQMDYVDLYQIHRWDYDTPIEETMEALHDLVKMGKVRYIGASSMFLRQFMKAQHIAETRGWTKFVSMQNHYNLIYREEEREMMPYCKETGVGVIPWSPLARGFLTGGRGSDRTGETVRSKTDTYTVALYTDDSDFQVLEAVKTVAAKYNKPLAQIALAWMLHKGEITAPIVGASKMSHLEDAIAAVQIKLTEEDIAALESNYKPHKVAGHV
jgi:1-deoxyxylulose-5-phosphate synthase